MKRLFIKGLELLTANNAYTKSETNNNFEKKLTKQDKDNLVKNSLVDNSNVLNDEEKLKIETWLGLSENYLTMYNDTPYQVNNDYNPAHKKYVDEKVSEIEMFKFPNATIIGTPTITHGQVSDFSQINYLEFPFLVDFRGRKFEINFAFTTGTDVINQQNILDSEFGLAFAIRNSNFILALSYNGYSWATEQTGSLVLQPQTTYRVRISWNGLLYRVQYSLDGGNTYIDDITFGLTQSPYPKQMFIGVGRLANNYFTGSINLNFANVKISDELIWQGMDDVGLATRLAIDLSNIDSAGIERIKEYAGMLPAEQYSLGTVRGNEEYGFKVNNGYPTGTTKNYSYYLSAPGGFLISKGTLENVLDTRAYTTTNYVDDAVNGVKAMIGQINQELATLTDLEV